MNTPPESKIFISEADLEHALIHLEKRPNPRGHHVGWTRHDLLEATKAAVPHSPQIGDSYPIADGVFATVKVYGEDIATPCVPEETRLQLWYSIRWWSTDLHRMVSLEA